MPHYTENYEALEGIFRTNGIVPEAPGFYDQQAFFNVERTDHEFLNCYASFVRQRPRTAEYDADVRNKIPRIVNILHRELVADGRRGACVDMSMLLSRILEAEGIWNYIVKGALTLKFPERHRLNPQFFWPYDIDHRTGRMVSTGHAWVAAPPYNVIDITLQQQPFTNIRMRDHVPEHILWDTIQRVTPVVDDICSAEIRAMHPDGRAKDFHFIVSPSLRHVFSSFPANEQYVNQTRLRYIPCAFAAPDVSLAEMKDVTWNGRLGQEVYEQLIRVGPLEAG